MPEEKSFGVWSCYGTCDLCNEIDPSTGNCTNWSVEQANVVASDGTEYPKYVCAASDSEAISLCEVDFSENIAAAYPEQRLQNCTVTGGPSSVAGNCDDLESYRDAYLEDEDYGVEEEGAESRRERSRRNQNVSLSRTALKLTSASSSLSVTWRGTTSSQSLSGFAQVIEDPFVLSHFYFSAQSAFTFGTESYQDASLFLTTPLRGVLGNDGSYSLPLGRVGFRGSYTRNDYGYVVDLIGLRGATTGSFNFTNNTFTGGMTLKNRADALVLTLAGQIMSAPPVASFTVGTVSNCTVPVDGTGSSDPDGGTIGAWKWKVNGRPAGTGSTKSLTVRQGTNVVELRVKDGERSVSKPAAAKVVVNATPPCP